MKQIKTIQRLTAAVLAAALIFPLTSCDPGVTELEAPAGVTASADGLHSVKVSWTEAEDATAYAVSIAEPGEEVSAGSSSSNEDSASEPSSEASGAGSDSEAAKPPDPNSYKEVETTETVFDGLKADTDYRVTVTAVYQDDSRRVESEPSAPVSVRTGVPKAGTAEGLTAAADGETQIAVTWQPYSPGETNADGSAAKVAYTLYTADSEDGEYTAAAERTEETSYTHSGLSGSTTKYYKVETVITVDGKDYTGEKTPAASATTDAPPPPPEPEPAPSQPVQSQQPSSNGGGSGSGQQNGGSAASKKEQARAVAQQIADSIGPGTDLERVSKAAVIVSGYCAKATYTTSGPDYCEAYGVFIKGEYSCAGATRALGMVLTCMGYKWQHVNENQWTHQWCVLEMDGQPGYADGQVGWADYGTHPVA
ncbi:MAG: fibronectin type III domain-containing protein [Oscillospiraceae bacterium]|nr:fibronectin type III domain-containing protein [Oscillospiraceae bacterium]